MDANQQAFTETLLESWHAHVLQSQPVDIPFDSRHRRTEKSRRKAIAFVGRMAEESGKTLGKICSHCKRIWLSWKKWRLAEKIGWCFFFYLTDHWDLSRDSVTRTETRAGMCENTACGRCFFHSNPWAFSSRPRLTTGGFSILCPKTCGSRQKKNPRKFAGAYGSQIIIVGGLYPIYFWCFSPSYSLSILQIHIWNQRNSQNILET